jgi:hypothetical protein
MPVKKGSTIKSTVKKEVLAAKKTAKPDLKKFLDEVENKAYELYQKRIKSGVSGDDISDWFQAEKEIKEHYKL